MQLDNVLMQNCDYRDERSFQFQRGGIVLKAVSPSVKRLRGLSEYGFDVLRCGTRGVALAQREIVKRLPQLLNLSALFWWQILEEQKQIVLSGEKFRPRIDMDALDVKLYGKCRASNLRNDHSRVLCATTHKRPMSDFKVLSRCENSPGVFSGNRGRCHVSSPSCVPDTLPRASKPQLSALSQVPSSPRGSVQTGAVLVSRLRSCRKPTEFQRLAQRRTRGKLTHCFGPMTITTVSSGRDLSSPGQIPELRYGKSSHARALRGVLSAANKSPFVLLIKVMGIFLRCGKVSHAGSDAFAGIGTGISTFHLVCIRIMCSVDANPIASASSGLHQIKACPEGLPFKASTNGTWTRSSCSPLGRCNIWSCASCNSACAALSFSRDASSFASAVCLLFSLMSVSRCLLASVVSFSVSVEDLCENKSAAMPKITTAQLAIVEAHETKFGESQNANI